MRQRLLEWMTMVILVGVIALVAVVYGCAPTGPLRYESDPEHYPYYRPAPDDGVGFVPRGNGIIVGGPRNGAIKHNDRIYHEDGSLEFIQRR